MLKGKYWVFLNLSPIAMITYYVTIEHIMLLLNDMLIENQSF